MALLIPNLGLEYLFDKDEVLSVSLSDSNKETPAAGK
jgi:hypothetical protein